MDQDLMGDAEEALRLNRTIRLLQPRFFKVAYASQKVSLPQYSVLAVLQEHGESTMGQLAESLGITMGAVTSLVDRLIHLGYVERERSTEDRRVVKVRLTSAGGDMLQYLLDHGKQLAADMLEDVSPEDRRVFLRVQQNMVEKFAEVIKRLEKDGP